MFIWPTSRGVQFDAASRTKSFLQWKGCGTMYKNKSRQTLINSIHKSTSESIARAIGGTDVNPNVIIPNRLIDKLESAAARGSDSSKSAVAIALEFPPNVTPLLT
jgi:hypothetical protein